jgi:GntR family transcriptional repressor for pyruvate dehydrogenase complex
MPSTEIFSKIESTDKIGQILSAIQNSVIDGHWPSGTKLPSEKDMAKEFGVSRFSLREALRVAEAQGLIKIQQGKRPVVISPSASPIKTVMNLVMKRTQENLVDLAKARSGLECVIAQIAAEKITETELNKLEENVTLMAIQGRDLDYYVAKDAEFHDIILKSTKSIVFEIMLSSVTPLIAESIKMTLANGGVERANQLHKEIYSALHKHDVVAAGQKMALHMQNAEEDLQKVL